MDRNLKDKSIRLEELKIDEEIVTKELSISEKKAMERKLKSEYGRDWRKVLGLQGAGLQDLYNFSPELRGAVRPHR